MDDKQKRFLYLAVIEGAYYKDIEHKLGIKRKEFAPWWDEFKDERIALTIVRDIWKKKCPDINFEEFQRWYNNAEKKCFYCGVTEKDLSILWEKYPNLTKRKRGKKLEIERMEPNLSYNDTSNLVFSCYWCNNAKTDTFTKEEFQKIGKVIEEIWEERLK